MMTATPEKSISELANMKKAAETKEALQLKVNPDFEALLDPLLTEESECLEQNILEHGLLSPLFVGKDGTIYDGHTRFKICKKHNLKIRYKVIDLGDKEAIEDWIIEHQLGRRNLTEFQKAEYALKHKERIAAKAKANQRAAGGAVPQKSAEPVDTRKEVAKQAGVSTDTVSKVQHILEHADEETKEKLRKGEKGTSINKVHNEIKAQNKSAESIPTPINKQAEKPLTIPKTGNAVRVKATGTPFTYRLEDFGIDIVEGDVPVDRIKVEGLSVEGTEGPVVRDCWDGLTRIMIRNLYRCIIPDDSKVWDIVSVSRRTPHGQMISVRRFLFLKA